ncbi:choline/carnitine O-acyltransferase [Serratia marcescens]|uniref:choline/carnitine O-acyltransferase n=1 Tax=Serratia marcescens TaxID=615 RepID=UPI00165DA36F|nr:choline/carnitine O-acyltransferase [Serratia marcescens]
MNANQNTKATSKSKVLPKTALSLRGLYRQLFDCVHIINGYGKIRSHWVSAVFIASVSLFHGLDCLRRKIIPRQGRYAYSVAHFYLSCRESLPFFNNFPITLANRSRCDEVPDALAAWLCKAYQEGNHSSDIAALFSTFRLPGHFCDTLSTPDPAEYFAILHAGSVIRVSLSYCGNPGALSALLKAVMQRIPAGGSGLTLSECASYHRRGWSKISRRLQGPGRDALHILQQSRFVLCLDKTQQTDTARGARFAHLHNRFCDKAIQICADLGTGQLMLLCEHAAVDAVAANRLIDQLACRPLVSTPVEDLKPLPPLTYFSNAVDSQCCNATNSAKIRRYLAHWKARFDCAAGFVNTCQPETLRAQGISTDLVIQLAIYAAFRDCVGRNASMYEPVSLAAIPGRSLDFINPVNPAMLAFVRNRSPRQRVACLREATRQHHAQITRAKEGMGMLSHLLHMTYFSSLGGAFNAINQWLMRGCLLTVIPAIRFIYQRDVMASNGMAHPGITSFGTLCHQPAMVGVGYLISRNGIALDVVSSHAISGGVCPHKLVRRIEANIRSIADAVPDYGGGEKI